MDATNRFGSSPHYKELKSGGAEATTIKKNINIWVSWFFCPNMENSENGLFNPIQIEKQTNNNSKHVFVFF